jgi:hypothetical protein
MTDQVVALIKFLLIIDVLFRGYLNLQFLASMIFYIDGILDDLRLLSLGFYYYPLVSYFFGYIQEPILLFI